MTDKILEKSSATCVLRIKSHNPDFRFRLSGTYFRHGVSATQHGNPLVLRLGSVETVAFRKTSFSPHGTSGVLTFEIRFDPTRPMSGAGQQEQDDNVEQLALMWHVSRAVGKKNSHAVGIFKKVKAGEKLFKKMDALQKNDQDGCRKTASERINYRKNLLGRNVTVAAEITNDLHASWNIEIY